MELNLGNVLNCLNACDDARQWALRQRQSVEGLWNRCNNIMWLMYVLDELVTKDSRLENIYRRYDDGYEADVSPKTARKIRKMYPYSKVLKLFKAKYDNI